jgi:hypothetical protein
MRRIGSGQWVGGALLLGALLALTSSEALAEGLELSGWGGLTLPTWSQALKYDPGNVVVPIPGVTLDQHGAFTLKATGGLAFGGGISYFPTKAFGIEGRFDSERIDIETQNPSYSVTVTPPAPLPPFSTDVTLANATVQVDALTPWSLNLKLRGSGPLRFYISGGLSYLPSWNMSITQPIAIGVTAISGQQLVLGTISVTANSVGQESTSSWGWNAGLGLEIGLGPKAAIVAEARYFQFGTRTLVWTPEPKDLTPVEQALLDRVMARLPPVVFDPAFFHATAGLVVRF